VTFAASRVTGGDVGFGSAANGLYGLEEGDESFVSTINSTALVVCMLDVWAEGMAVRDISMAILGAAFAVLPSGGITFTPGNWNAVTLEVVAGATITLDGQGDPNAHFHFRVNTTMLMGAGCSIILIKGATTESVSWAIGTSLNVGAGAHFEGSIVAGTAIVFGGDSVILGSILAGTDITFGGVTVIDGDVIAGTAITFGAVTEVYGSVVGGTAVVFGAENIIAAPTPECPSVDK
jgi:hypothetical protein